MRVEELCMDELRDKLEGVRAWLESREFNTPDGYEYCLSYAEDWFGEEFKRARKTDSSKLELYGDFKPRSRAQELELYAFKFVEGGEISAILTMIDPKLGAEYDKFYEDEDGN